MANTKKIDDRVERKTAKREQRQKLKELFAGLSKKEKKAYKESETKGLRAWVEEQKGEE